VLSSDLASRIFYFTIAAFAVQMIGGILLRSRPRPLPRPALAALTLLLVSCVAGVLAQAHAPSPTQRHRSADLSDYLLLVVMLWNVAEFAVRYLRLQRAGTVLYARARQHALEFRVIGASQVVCASTCSVAAAMITGTTELINWLWLPGWLFLSLIGLLNLRYGGVTEFRSRGILTRDCVYAWEDLGKYEWQLVDHQPVLLIQVTKQEDPYLRMPIRYDPKLEQILLEHGLTRW